MSRPVLYNPNRQGLTKILGGGQNRHILGKTIVGTGAAPAELLTFEGLATPDNLNSNTFTFTLTPPAGALDLWAFIHGINRQVAPGGVWAATLDLAAMLDQASYAGGGPGINKTDCHMMHLAAGGVGTSLVLTANVAYSAFFAYIVYFSTSPFALDAAGSDRYLKSGGVSETMPVLYAPSGAPIIAVSTGSLGNEPNVSGLSFATGNFTIVDERASPLSTNVLWDQHLWLAAELPPLTGSPATVDAVGTWSPAPTGLHTGGHLICAGN